MIVLGITPDGEADEDEIERGQFDLEEDTLDLIKVEIVPNPDLEPMYFYLPKRESLVLVTASESVMWVILDYLEKYTSYWQ